MTVVRHRPDPVPGAARTLGVSRLHEALAGAQVVFLALALTPSTEHIIGAAELAAMRPDAWLVNVARGPHVDTDALVAALSTTAPSAARPSIHRPRAAAGRAPPVELERCIITPHTADTQEMIEPLLAHRIPGQRGALRRQASR